jgi:hypothetical protein
MENRNLFHLRFFKKHFSLVEVIMALGIFSLVIGGLFTLTNQGQRMYSRGTWQLNSQKMAQQALFRLQEDLARASNQVRITGGNIIEDRKDVLIWSNCSNPLPDGTILSQSTPAANKIDKTTAGPRAVMSWNIFEPLTDLRVGAWCGCVLVYQNRQLRYYRGYLNSDFSGLDTGDLTGTLIAPPVGYDGYAALPSRFTGGTFKNKVILEDVDSFEIFFKTVTNGQIKVERQERSIGLRVTLRSDTGNWYDRQRSVIEATSAKLNRNVQYTLK